MDFAFFKFTVIRLSLLHRCVEIFTDSYAECFRKLSFPALHLAIFVFWIVVIVLSYGLLFLCIDDPLCSAVRSCIDQVCEIVIILPMTSPIWPTAPFHRMSKFSQTQCLRMTADLQKLQILTCKSYSAFGI